MSQKGKCLFYLHNFLFKAKIVNKYLNFMFWGQISYTEVHDA